MARRSTTQVRVSLADAAGSIYVSGYSYGSLAAAILGGSDALLSKYDANGQHQWTRQFGTERNDQARGVVTDAVGDIYVSGWTNQINGNNPNSDPFVSKYDTAGALLWTRAFDGGSTGYDRSRGIASDGADGIYIAGDFGHVSGARDVFLRKYDTNGNLQWTRQLGTPEFD